MRFFVILALVLLVRPAMAADQCDDDRVQLDAKISACSARISDPSTTPHNRAGAMINRGNANVGAMLLHRARRLDAVMFGKNRGQADEFETNHLDAAIRDFNQALAILGDTSDGAIAYNDRGIAYGDKGDRAKAISDYTAAIRIKPDYAGAYFNRGMDYASDHDYDKAIADFSAAIRAQPRNVNYLMQRADAYRESGQEDRAIADYDQVLRIEPGNDLATVWEKSIADGRKSRDDAMAQNCVDVRRTPSGEVAFGNHCRFDVKAKMTNPQEPIIEIAAGATETRRMDLLVGNDVDLQIFVDKVCRSSDGECVRKIEADRAATLARIEQDRRNEKYIEACQNLMTASSENAAKQNPQDIQQWRQTCEQNPDRSYCEAASWNIRQGRPDYPPLACVNAPGRAAKTAPPAESRPAQAPSSVQSDGRVANAPPSARPSSGPNSAPSADAPLTSRTERSTFSRSETSLTVCNQTSSDEIKIAVGEPPFDPSFSGRTQGDKFRIQAWETIGQNLCKRFDGAPDYLHIESSGVVLLAPPASRETARFCVRDNFLSMSNTQSVGGTCGDNETSVEFWKLPSLGKDVTLIVGDRGTSVASR